MEKKSIIIVLVLIILGVIIIIPRIKNNKKHSANDDILSMQIQVDEQNAMTIEANLNLAIEKCRNLYVKNGKKDFNIEFSINSIDAYFENGKISLISELDSLDVEHIVMYDNEGKEINNIPEEIEYEKNTYDIEPDKKYLIKVYSLEDSKIRYYQLKINNLGYADIQLKFYTEGEDNSILFNNDFE